MRDAEVQYRQLLAEQDKASLDTFAQSLRDQEAQSPTNTPTIPSAGEAPIKKPSVVGAGIAATKETLTTGYEHFVNAMDTFGKKNTTLEDLSGHGEALLGGLTVLMALPAGVGATLEQAMKNYTPGLAESVALSSTPSAAIRAILGLPDFILNPETRRLLFTLDTSKLSNEEIAKREAIIDALHKPMTYGELINSAASIAIPGLLLKGVKGRGLKPEPLQVQDAVRIGDIGSKTTISLMSPEDMTSRIKTVAAQLGHIAAEKTPQKGIVAPEQPPTSTPKPETKPIPHFEEPISPPEYPDYPKTLQSALGIAQARASKLISEEAKTTPGLKKLLSKEKPTAEETIAVAKEAQGSVAVSEPEPFDPLASRQPQSRGKRPKLDVMGPLDIGGEAGKVNLELVSRMAIGAAIGGTQGDTPEERIVYALGGMIGLGFAKRLVGALRKDPRTAPLLDEINPKMPGTSLPQDILDPIQRVIKTSTAPEHIDAINKILRADPEVPLTREDLRQGEVTKMKALKSLRDMTDNILNGEVFPDGELKNTMAFALTLHDNILATGRKIGATGEKGMEGVRVAMGKIRELATEFSPTESEHALAVAIKASGAIENVGLLTRLNYAIPETILQAWYGSVLTGKAAVKVPIGTAPMMPVAIWDRSLAALKFWDANRPSLSEVPQGFVAMMEGTLDQFKIMKDWRNAWNILGDQVKELYASPIDVAPRGFEALADITRTAGEQLNPIAREAADILAKGFDFMNSAANFGPGVVARVHGMFKAINGRIAIQWEAMEQAKREGLTGDNYKSRVADLVSDYSQLPAEALVRITQFRDHQTFTAPFQSRLMQAIQSGPENPWTNLAYRIAVLPFARIGVRLSEIGAEYTPGLNLLSENFRREIRAGGTAQSVALARIATGTTMISAFTYLGMQGLITGSLPGHEKDAVLGAAGRPPHSFWDPLSQKWRDYSGMHPFAQWISTGADFAYLLGQLPEHDAERLMTAAGVAMSANTGQEKFLQPLSQIMTAITEGNTDQQWEKVLDIIRKDFGGFAPVGLKEGVGAIEGGEKTRTMKTGQFDETPGVSSMLQRELKALRDDYARAAGLYDEKSKTIKVLRNMFTGDKLTNDSWPFNPYTSTPDQPEPWAAEIRRLDGAGLKPLPDFIGGTVEPNLGLKDQPGMPGVRLTAPEKDRLEVLMTQVVKNRSGHLTEALNNLVQSPLYARQTDYDKRTLIQGLWTEFRLRAEFALQKEHPELANDIRLKEGTVMIERHVPLEKQAAAKERLRIKIGPGIAP